MLQETSSWSHKAFKTGCGRASETSSDVLTTLEFDIKQWISGRANWGHRNAQEQLALDAACLTGMHCSWKRAFINETGLKKNPPSHIVKLLWTHRSLSPSVSDIRRPEVGERMLEADWERPGVTLHEFFMHRDTDTAAAAALALRARISYCSFGE